MQAPRLPQLTDCDVDFLTRTLAGNPSSPAANALLRLLADEEECGRILDDPLLYEALVESAAPIGLSTSFYFHVLVRRAMLRRGFDTPADRELAGYVAAVLAAFARREHLDLVLEGEARPAKGARAFGYLSDLLAAAEQAPAGRAFARRLNLADFALFQSGLFKETLDAKEQRRGAPSVVFYEAVGSAGYRAAARFPEAERCRTRPLFDRLGEAFHDIRLALNEMTEKSLHFEVFPALPES